MRNRPTGARVSGGMLALVRLVAAVSVALAFALLAVRPALACSCAGMTMGQALAGSDVVFVGTVTDAPPPPPLPGEAVGAPGIDQGVAFTFEVEGVAKGDVAQPAVVMGGFNSAMCGMSFAVGERWLVFAAGEGGALSTDLCAGSMPLADGEEPPLTVRPVEAAAGAQASFSIPGPVLVAGAGVVLLAAASYLAFGRRAAR